MNILDALRATGDWANSNIPRLNYGGCGVYAAAVATSLAALQVPVHGVVIKGWRDAADLDIARRTAQKPPRTVTEWNQVNIGFEHVRVVARIAGRWWVHDSHYTEALESDHPGPGYIRGTLSVSELCNIARCRRGWNTAFDRKLYLKSVKMITRKYLSQGNVEVASDEQTQVYF